MALINQLESSRVRTYFSSQNYCFERKLLIVTPNFPTLLPSNYINAYHRVNFEDSALIFSPLLTNIYIIIFRLNYLVVSAGIWKLRSLLALLRIL